MRVLILGYVWPEPCSSAAGSREMSLIEIFRDAGWDVIYASPSRESEYSEKLRDAGVSIASVSANDSAFDAWAAGINPDVVVFDRFVMEEQFGWRIRENCPDAVRIIDTQDLHFLRRTRADAVEEGVDPEQIFAADLNFAHADTYREIASFLRSDLSLVLSDFELALLKENFPISDDLLFHAPLTWQPPAFELAPGFHERKGFAMIGNFRHAPNADATKWLKETVWPEIRKLLPDAEVSIFGSYPPKDAMALSDLKTGFHVKGPLPPPPLLHEKLSRYRVNLAPLRFGAGQKGKILDGWVAGMPCATTPIGAEGMGWNRASAGDWGGLVERDASGLARAAVTLHEESALWRSASKRGAEILGDIFSQKKLAVRLTERIVELKAHLKPHREKNFTGSLLWHHTLQSTKYFSKWIEEKNRPRLPGTQVAKLGGHETPQS